MPASLKGAIGRPSYSCPPSSMNTAPRTCSARSGGQSQNGGSEALAGNPIRTAATRARSRRCTTALMKWVVPMTTPSILLRAISGPRVSSPSAVTTPVVTSDVVGVLTACATFPFSSITASVLVPPTSIPIRRIALWALVEDGAEVELVTEGARPDMIEPLRRQENRRRGKHDDGDPPAIPDGFRAECFARYGVQHADQFGGHRDRGLVAPRHDPFVLERDLKPRSAVFVEAFNRRPAAQKPLRGAAGDIDGLAAEDEFAVPFVEDRVHRVFVLPLRLPHAAADADSFRHSEMDAPILDLAPGARRLAGRGDRAELDADLAADPLHPFPARDLGHHRLDAARIVEHARIGAKITDRDARHLRLGIGTAHRIRVDDRKPEMGRRHQRLDTVAAADLERHHRAELCP